MFTVYVLYSKKFSKIYIGVTSNIEKRIFAHNNLPKGWTRSFRPWTLIYSETYALKQEALRREKQLKSAQGRKFIWNMVKEKFPER